VCVCVCACVCVCVCVCVNIHIYMHTYTYIHTYIQDRLPRGHYVMLVSLVERVGGEKLRWSGGAEHTLTRSRPKQHLGRFFDLDLRESHIHTERERETDRQTDSLASICVSHTHTQT
jgi:hypothetical protein